MNADLIVFDEIHKIKGWKSFLKGVFDTRPDGQAILVTGSARLDALRQTGESLAGRYFHLRLHPLSVKELADDLPVGQALDRLNRLGGFPEPFLSGSEEEAARWRSQYNTDLVREVDFVVAEDRRLSLLLEAKLSDDLPSPHFAYFKEAIPEARAVQIVGRLKRESRDKGIEISRAAEWLSRLEA